MLSGSGVVGDGGLETWQKDFGPKSSVPESFTFFPALVVRRLDLFVCGVS